MNTTTSSTISVATNSIIEKQCGLKQTECEQLLTLKKVLFAITIVFDSLTLLMILILKKYHTFSQRIFLYILLCNLGEAISNLMSDGDSDLICTVAGYFVQLTGFAQFMWVGGLTVFLVSLLHIKKPERRLRERTYLFICFGVPLILSFIPFVFDDVDGKKLYGPAGAFCWIINDGAGEWLRFVAWWVPVFLGIILILITFIALHVMASRKKFPNTCSTGQTSHKSLVKNYLRPLTGYAAFFVLLHTLMLIDRVYTAESTNEPLFVLRILHMIGYASYGYFLCSLFYIMSGRKEFTPKKLKRAILRKSKDKAVTFKIETATHTLYDAADRHYPTRSISVSDEQSDDDVKHGNNVQSDADVELESDSLSQKDDNIKEQDDSALPQSRLSLELWKYGSSSPFNPQYSTSDSLQKHQLEVDIEKPSAVKSSLEHPKCMLRKNSESDYELTELDSDLSEPVFSMPVQESRESHQVSPGELATCDTPDTSCPSVFTYELKSDCSLFQIFISADHVRWENWNADETVASWVSRLREDLPARSTVTIKDQNGAIFGRDVTWKQIQSACSTVQIIVGSSVTKIKLNK